MKISRTKNEWQQLLDLYYEGRTTRQEDAELADYLFNNADAQTSDHDADRAVLSYLITGRRLNAKNRRSSRSTLLKAAAAIIGITLATYTTIRLTTTDDFTMSINGKKYYSETMAAEHMEQNLAMALADFTTVEDELSQMFSD